MRGRHGFTLIELLAVLVILGAISLTAVMGISASLERRDEKEVVEQEELAKNAAKIYFSLSDNLHSVRVQVLIDEGYIDKGKISKLDSNKCIVVGNGNYQYTDC